jgi:hypothetical protein
MVAIIVVSVPVVVAFMFPVGTSVIVMIASSLILPERLCRPFIALAHHVLNPETKHERMVYQTWTEMEIMPCRSKSKELPSPLLQHYPGGFR